MNKTSDVNFDSQKLIEEFFKNGGQIQVLPTIQPDKSLTTTVAHRKELQLLTLPEAADLYGKKIIHKKKEKEVDSDKLKEVNKDLIPQELHHIFDKAKL
jgi:hypothetical protein